MEILVVLTLVSLLAVFVINTFSVLNQSQALSKNADMVATTLRQARSLTLASKGGNQYGVHIEATRVVLFQGPTYTVNASSNVSYALNRYVNISSINLVGSGSEVIFDRLTGDTTESGTVTLSLISTPASTRVVSISGTGLIQ